jgi:hypothetical protein
MSMRQAITRADEVERFLRSQPDVSPREATLMKVISADAISGGVGYRWVYTVRLAVVGSTSSYVPQEDETVNMEAISVSELSNVAASSYSYGVPPADLPGGFVPVRIPNGTYVECVPHRRTDGSFIWLIVNTQAITGQCSDNPLADIVGSDHITWSEPTIAWRFKPQRRVWLSTECTTADDYTTSVSGTGAAVTFNDAAIHTLYHVGIANCTTGTTTTGRAAVVTPTFDCIQLGSGACVLEMMVRTPSSLSDATNRYNLICGLHDSISTGSTPVDGAAFIYRDNLNGGKWQAITASATSGANTTADTGITVAASTWYCLRVEVNATATEAKFYIDEALVATITTNIASGAADQTGVCVGIRKGAGTTARNMYVDYVDFSQDFTRCAAS